MSGTTVKCAIYLCSNSVAGDLREQERRCRDAAQNKGWEIRDEHVYSDLGVTGRSFGGRVGLESLIQAVKTEPGIFQTVLVADAARLSRDLWNVLQTVDVLSRHGVEVHLVNLELSSKDPRFTILIPALFQLEYQYAYERAQKSKRALEERIRMAYSAGGHENVAVDKVDEHGRRNRRVIGTRLKIVPGEAEVIRAIYRMCANGIGVSAIARKLNTDGAPAPRQNRADSSVWTGTAVRRILHNERYVGTTVWGRTKRVSDPRSERILRHMRPNQETYRVSMPDLRIVEDEM
jgi:DNA invertase Pin-like site-specific DNA recombinase